jgi:hypothetical protein
LRDSHVQDLLLQETSNDRAAARESQAGANGERRDDSNLSWVPSAGYALACNA